MEPLKNCNESTEIQFKKTKANVWYTEAYKHTHISINSYLSIANAFRQLTKVKTRKTQLTEIMLSG